MVKTITIKEIEEEVLSEDNLASMEINAHILALTSIIMSKLGVSETELNSLKDISFKNLKSQFLQQVIEQIKSEGYEVIE